MLGPDDVTFGKTVPRAGPRRRRAAAGRLDRATERDAIKTFKLIISINDGVSPLTRIVAAVGNYDAGTKISAQLDPA